jgi:hypothetical protein
LQQSQRQQGGCVMAYTNGQLPPEALSPIASGQLANTAAAAWNALNQEARRLGLPELRPTGALSSYRTYEQQVYLWREYQAGRGSLAARPGESNHGWGIAVDVATKEMRATIDKLGSKYGWAKRCSDAQSEWWHVRWDSTGSCTGTSYHGPDPGPYGRQAPHEPPPQVYYITPPAGGPVAQIAVMQNKDGRIEVFVLKDDGYVFHKWQSDPNKSFVKDWSSLGKP